MSALAESVPVIHPWVIHLATSDDEFAARCGASEEGMLVAEAKVTAERWLLIGYRMCEKCEAVCANLDSRED